jgi:hypothetical protein
MRQAAGAVVTLQLLPRSYRRSRWARDFEAGSLMHQSRPVHTTRTRAMAAVWPGIMQHAACQLESGCVPVATLQRSERSCQA